MINVFGVELRLYGLLVGLGVFVGASISSWVIKAEKEDPDLMWDGLVWVVVLGVVGARAYHVIDKWDYYGKHMDRIVAIWSGGLGIFGALFGGMLGLVAFLWFKRNLFSGHWTGMIGKYLDAVSLGIPLGQAIGRWGNFVNQELYGWPTDLPWGIYIKPENRLPGLESFDRFHPLFLYESMLSFLVFLLLLWLYKAKNFRFGGGRYFGSYMILYGMVRIVMETMKPERWMLGNLPTASVVSMIMIIIGLGLFGVRWKRT